MKRIYKSWLKGEVKSEQREYTEPTKLLDSEGNLLAAGWARHNVFEYDRNLVKKSHSRKEWDFYQRGIYGADKLCQHFNRRICLCGAC